jgi:hypothetical protein
METPLFSFYSPDRELLLGYSFSTPVFIKVWKQLNKVLVMRKEN